MYIFPSLLQLLVMLPLTAVVKAHVMKMVHVIVMLVLLDLIAVVSVTVYYQFSPITVTKVTMRLCTLFLLFCSCL